MIWSPMDVGIEKVGNVGGDSETPGWGNQMKSAIASQDTACLEEKKGWLGVR